MITATIANTPDRKIAGSRVLVVDDNQDASMTLAMLLRLKNYEVTTCNSGREALDKGNTLSPDVVLLDIGMPGLDGFETCKLIRQQPWGQSAVLVAITGYGQEKDMQRCQQAGFNAHLVKPVDMTELDKLLNSLLKQN